MFALLAGEGLVRAFSPCPDYGGGIRPAFYSNLFEYDRQLGWKGVSNLSTPYYSKDFRITVSHDAAGYRNISPPYVPGKDNYLLLGDSYAWGWGVEDNETAAAVFNHRHPDANLYSLGIAGYGTDQAWLSMQQHLAQHPAYRYRGAILLFYFNDFEDNAATERYGYPKPAFVLTDSGLQLTNVPVPHKAVPQDIPVNFIPEPNDWTSRIQLLNFVFQKLPGLVAQFEEKDLTAKNVGPSPETLRKIELATSLLAAVEEDCRQRGMFFHVVILQTHDTQDENLAAVKLLAERLTAQGIQHSTFRSRRLPNTDLWLDAHYSPYGQALLARHIEQFTFNKQ